MSEAGKLVRELDGQLAERDATIARLREELEGSEVQVSYQKAAARAFKDEHDSLAADLAALRAEREKMLAALTDWNIKLTQLGAIAAFLFLMAGASRLARFNITSNPQPSNPGRPGKKYFVGMPIPAGAGVIAAVVHFQSGVPLESWYTAMTWLAMVAAVGYLMVSTWRFYSFKDIDFSSRHPFRLIVVLGGLVAGIWFFSKPVLFAVALLYTFSGVFWRLQWIFRRKKQPPPPAYKELSQTS